MPKDVDPHSHTKPGDGGKHLEPESIATEKQIIGSYPTINDVPTGESAGFIAVTETGHLIVEDGK